MEQFSKKKQLAMQNRAIDTGGRGVVWGGGRGGAGGGGHVSPPYFFAEDIFFS